MANVRLPGHRRLAQWVVERENNAQRIYDYCAEYIADRRYAPSIQDIADACYMSRSNVVRYLDLLEARGFIERGHNIPRSIRIRHPSDDF